MLSARPHGEFKGTVSHARGVKDWTASSSSVRAWEWLGVREPLVHPLTRSLPADLGTLLISDIRLGKPWEVGRFWSMRQGWDALGLGCAIKSPVSDPYITVLEVFLGCKECQPATAVPIGLVQRVHSDRLVDGWFSCWLGWASIENAFEAQRRASSWRPEYRGIELPLRRRHVET